MNATQTTGARSLRATKPDKYNAVIEIQSDGSCRFRYSVLQVGGACFSLFCEIGEPVKPSFERILSEHGLRIAKDAVRLTVSPWLADVVENC